MTCSLGKQARRRPEFQPDWTAHKQLVTLGRAPATTPYLRTIFVGFRNRTIIVKYR